MITIEKLLENSGKLGSLPAIVHRIFAEMESPNSTAIRIGRIINDDPAITARLLKLVNSPFYGFTSKVDTVYRAIALIGHRELHSVVLAASAIKVFHGIPSDLVSMPVFWKRSLYTAVIARVLAAFKREKEIERFFIAGLLHDIGSLLLYLQLPEQMIQAIKLHQSENMPLWQAEKEIMGFDHAQVGGELLKKWSLPPVLCQSVRYHLYPDNAADSYQDGAQLVHLAWQIQRHYIDRDPMLGEEAEVSSSDWQANDLSEDLLDKILEKAEQQYEGSKDILLS